MDDQPLPQRCMPIEPTLHHERTPIHRLARLLENIPRQPDRRGGPRLQHLLIQRILEHVGAPCVG